MALTDGFQTITGSFQYEAGELKRGRLGLGQADLHSSYENTKTSDVHQGSFNEGFQD